MKLITAIKQQKNNKNRYAIYLDEEYAFSCNDELVVKLKLKSGNQIDMEKLEEIIQEDNIKESFNKALNYLTSRSRTQQEVIDYLTEKGFDNEAINISIDRLKGYQFIDDNRYASNFIKNKSQSQLKGKRLIQQELFSKGVDEDIIEESLTSYSSTDELENAIKIGTQYFFSKKNLPYNQIKQKLSNKLITKGYSWEIVSECLQNIEKDQEIQTLMENQQEVHYIEGKKLAEKYYEKLIRKEKNSFLLKKKLGAYLYQKGFQQELIQQIIDCF